MNRHALIVTYTMPEPAVVGVFFRALRLTEELCRRGWTVTVCNFGPLPEDPKVTRASRVARVLELGCPTIPTHRFAVAVDAGPEGIARFFQSLSADVIVFGEGPFGNMQQAYDAAASLPLPFILLEQYYGGWLLKPETRADRVLLYGLRSLWQRAPVLAPPYMMIPPFIGELAPASALPVPKALHEKRWFTVLGFEKLVLQRGIDLARRLDDPGVAAITLSHDPDSALQSARQAGIDLRRFAALPLQPDEVLFSLISRSHCVVLANGFMQVMEALCLGCPAIAVDRGLGMADWMLDDCFRAYVSSGEEADAQHSRAQGWLGQSPFSPALLSTLAKERNGAAVCAEQIEQVCAERRPTRT
jgi:glycosyltransferase involved in cell wall biosynthesis